MSKTTFKIEIIKKVLIVLSMLATFSFGIKYMLVGLIVSNFAAYAVSAVYIKSSLTHYFRHQLLDISTVLILAIGVGMGVYGLNYIQTGYIATLILQIAVYFLSYLLAIRVLFPTRWHESVAEIKKRISKNS
jgi:uncharacterized membrane protein YfcA